MLFLQHQQTLWLHPSQPLIGYWKEHENTRLIFATRNGKHSLPKWFMPITSPWRCDDGHTGSRDPRHQWPPHLPFLRSWRLPWESPLRSRMNIAFIFVPGSSRVIRGLHWMAGLKNFSLKLTLVWKSHHWGQGAAWSAVCILLWFLSQALSWLGYSFTFYFSSTSPKCSLGTLASIINLILP